MKPINALARQVTDGAARSTVATGAAACAATLIALLAGCAADSSPSTETATPAPTRAAIAAPMHGTSLRPVESFDSIADAATRSRALFIEAGKVIASPRCQNCHPKDDRPTQGEDMHPHQPMVVRGPDNMGAAGLRCTTCHQAANYAPSGVPGNPAWHLAPLSMAWQGQSLGQVCTQIKDPARNGGKTLAQIQTHMGHDDLVGWGWNPGGQRKPAAGTQAQFGALIDAWVATGAVCPAA